MWAVQATFGIGIRDKYMSKAALFLGLGEPGCLEEGCCLMHVVDVQE